MKPANEHRLTNSFHITSVAIAKLASIHLHYTGRCDGIRLNGAAYDAKTDQWVVRLLDYDAKALVDVRVEFDAFDRVREVERKVISSWAKRAA